MTCFYLRDGTKRSITVQTVAGGLALHFGVQYTPQTLQFIVEQAYKKFYTPTALKYASASIAEAMTSIEHDEVPYFMGILHFILTEGIDPFVDPYKEF